MLPMCARNLYHGKVCLASGYLSTTGDRDPLLSRDIQRATGNLSGIVLCHPNLNMLNYEGIRVLLAHIRQRL